MDQPAPQAGAFTEIRIAHIELVVGERLKSQRRCDRGKYEQGARHARRNSAAYRDEISKHAVASASEFF